MVSNGIKNGVVFYQPDTRKIVILKADNIEFPLWTSTNYRFFTALDE